MPAIIMRPKGATILILYKQACAYDPLWSTSSANALIKLSILLEPRPHGRDWLEWRWGDQPKCDNVL